MPVVNMVMYYAKALGHAARAPVRGRDMRDVIEFPRDANSTCICTYYMYVRS